jgi:hypothetical protein
MIAVGMPDVHLLFPYLSGAFATSQKATVSFIMSIRLSVRPSIHMEQLVSHWTGFDET